MNKEKDLEKDIAQYDTFDEKWMVIHNRICFGVFLVAVIIEFITSFFPEIVGDIFRISRKEYIAEFVINPGIKMLIFVLISFLMVKGERRKNENSKLIISLCFTGVGMVIYALHGHFDAMFVPLIASIIITTMYGQYKITSIVTSVVLIGVIIWRYTGETNADFIFLLVMIIGIYCISLAIIMYERQKMKFEKRKDEKNANMRDYLEREVNTDTLTRLYNRKALRSSFDQLLELEEKENNWFVMIDLNHFKELNDSFGHDAGDKCLQYFANILKKNTKDERFKAFRYGGDEFSIILLDSNAEEVYHVCKEICDEVERESMKKTGISFGACFGFAKYQEGMTISELVRNADSALYKAKNMESHICKYNY